MKAFVLHPGGADVYQGLGVRLVKGKPPVLVVDNASHPIRIDLAPLSTQEELHEVVRKNGFVPGPVRNGHESCYLWRNKGECHLNPTVMRDLCAKACSDLHDLDEAECTSWAKNGECDSNPTFMWGSCPVACGAWEERGGRGDKLEL